MPQYVHIATVSSAHGVKGAVKLYSLLEDPSLLQHFKQFYDETEQPLKLSVLSIGGKAPIVQFEHAKDKNAADTLKSTKIFVRADEFPEAEESEFYAYELVGLKVVDSNNQVIGTVAKLHNFGAGDVLELEFFEGESELLPFNDETFPEIDTERGTISFVPPSYV